MQTARKGVGAGTIRLLEFAARMQPREDEFDHGHVLLGMHAHRNASPVVLHRDDAVLVDGHRNLRAEPREDFVARVVDHFLDDVKGVVRERIHAGTLLDGLKALEHLNGTLAVVFFFLLLDGHCCFQCAPNAPRRKAAAGERPL